MTGSLRRRHRRIWLVLVVLLPLILLVGLLSRGTATPINHGQVWGGAQ